MYSPLEQFRLLPVVFTTTFLLDFSWTNQYIILFLTLFSFYVLSNFFLFLSFFLDTQGNSIIPNNRWFSIFDHLYVNLVGLVYTNVGLAGQIFFPFLFCLLLFILLANLVGLIPYSFTLTSHIIVTLSLAIIVFFGVNVLVILNHGLKTLKLFFPSGTAIELSFLIIPIELISYISKPVSLSVRLFANMMAGHTLLKVIASFAWKMMQNGFFLFIIHVVPLILLVILYGLELGVSLIQAYVFLVLCSIYINDSVHLH
jgi:ATP synthase subunit 6